MHTSTDAPHDEWVEFPFHSIRNISCPHDATAGRKIYSGHAPASSFVDLPDKENVRRYLVNAEGKLRKTPTQVHRQIRDTLENRPEIFSVLNGGIVLVAGEVRIDESKRAARLRNPSIINGSQTQGELQAYLRKMASPGMTPFEVYATFEIIESADDDLIAEISIARNFQNDVERLSIAGRRKQLDELELRIKEADPTRRLRKSETDRSEDFEDTEKLLQVITALIPQEIWPKADVASPNKVYTYSVKSKCLKEFQALHDSAKNPEASDHAQAALLYKFYLDIAPQALEIYKKWKSHNGFKGTGLRSLVRDEDGNILDVPDGIVFPILASLSAFAVQRNGVWTISPPKLFKDEELIRAAKAAYMEIAGSNPWNMGKSKACYSQLHQITSIYRKLALDPES